MNKITHEEIAKATEEFLKCGGKIKTLPPAPSIPHIEELEDVWAVILYTFADDPKPMKLKTWEDLLAEDLIEAEQERVKNNKHKKTHYRRHRLRLIEYQKNYYKNKIKNITKKEEKNRRKKPDLSKIIL